jgi:hypothetical protein
LLVDYTICFVLFRFAYSKVSLASRAAFASSRALLSASSFFLRWSSSFGVSFAVGLIGCFEGLLTTVGICFL